jgi:hypothetical protein
MACYRDSFTFVYLVRATYWIHPNLRYLSPFLFTVQSVLERVLMIQRRFGILFVQTVARFSLTDYKVWNYRTQNRKERTNANIPSSIPTRDTNVLDANDPVLLTG